MLVNEPFTVGPYFFCQKGISVLATQVGLAFPGACLAGEMKTFNLEDFQLYVPGSINSHYTQ